jgi:hypothetical protein
MAVVKLLLFDFLLTTQVKCSFMLAWARGGASLLILMLQGGFFNNWLYFFQAFLSYLYLLSFVLHEALLWDSSTIEPVRIFLQVIGIPAWSLPEVYVPAPRRHLEFGWRFGPGSADSRICCAMRCSIHLSWNIQRTPGVIGGAVSCSGFLICFALCCLTLITAIAVGAAIMHGMLPTAGYCMAGVAGNCMVLARRRALRCTFICLRMSTAWGVGGPCPLTSCEFAGLFAANIEQAKWKVPLYRFLYSLLTTFWLLFIRMFLVRRDR